MRSEKTTRPRALAPNRWPGSGVLETVHRLNARCLALFAQAAQETRAAQYSTGVYASRELWTRMDEGACRRAGTCPVFLLNLNRIAPISYQDEIREMIEETAAL